MPPSRKKGAPGCCNRWNGAWETVSRDCSRPPTFPIPCITIVKGQETIGYIHGVNQKGRYGGIQIVLALDLEGRILAFYYQRLTNGDARLLRDPAFGKQFVGLDLRDFDGYDVASGRAEPGSRIAAIRTRRPGPRTISGPRLRAVKKNLILSDEFLLGNRFLGREKSK